jgi:hypothetical protein
MGDAMSDATFFLSGFLTAGYATAALFFLRFWRDSRDRLFAFFAFGFALLAIQRALLPLVHPIEILYAVRLVAFLLMVLAIIEKNRHSAAVRES